MKCIIGILVLTIGAYQMISCSPYNRGGGMVFYHPDYYNTHRAYVMQYASQPAKSYRRQGQAAGVSAYVAGRRISTGTYLKQENQDPHGAHSVAEAYPSGPLDHHSAEIPDSSHDEEHSPPESYGPPHGDHHDEIPEVPKSSPRDDDIDHDDEEDEQHGVTKKSKNRPSAGSTYFPVSFGSTNGGAIAIANSYSTGKGGTASSRATAYGSPAQRPKSKRRNEH